MKKIVSVIFIFFLGVFFSGAETLTGDEKAQIIREEWNNLQPKKKAEVNETEKIPSISRPVPKTVIEKTVVRAPVFLSSEISLNTGSAPLRIILSEIATQLGVPIMTEEGVDPNVSFQGNFSRQKAKDVLEDICELLDYAWEVKDGTVYISRFGSLNFQIAIPCVTTQYSSSINLSAGNNAGGSSNIYPNNTTSVPAATTTTGQTTPAASSASSTNNVSGPNSSVTIYTDPVSLYKEIEDNLKNLVSSDGKYAVNKTAGTVFVFDRVKNLKRISEYFKILNKILSREILVKAKVVEVTLDSGFQTGVNWNMITNQAGFHTNFDLITDGPVLVMRSRTDSDAGNTTNGLNAVINLLETQGKTSVLSEPQATVLNGQPAIIQMADIVSYVAQVSQVVTQTGSQTAMTPGQVMQGVNMTIIPKVSDDGIFLNVMPSVTMIKNIRQINSLDATIEVPEISSRALNTSVKIQNGDIIAIGGLIYDQEQTEQQGIPFLSKIPLIGGAFKQKTNSKTKTELLIFLTAREV